MVLKPLLKLWKCGMRPQHQTYEGLRVDSGNGDPRKSTSCTCCFIKPAQSQNREVWGTHIGVLNLGRLSLRLIASLEDGLKDSDAESIFMGVHTAGPCENSEPRELQRVVAPSAPAVSADDRLVLLEDDPVAIATLGLFFSRTVSYARAGQSECSGEAVPPQHGVA